MFNQKSPRISQKIELLANILILSALVFGLVPAAFIKAEASNMGVTHPYLLLTSQNPAIPNIPPAPTASPSTPNVKIASFIINGSNTQDVRLGGLSLLTNKTFSGNFTNLHATINLAPIGTTVGLPASATIYKFSAGIIIPKSTQNVVDVYADISALAPVNTYLTPIAFTGVFATGAIDNHDYYANKVYGQEVLFANSVLKVSTDSRTPGPQTSAPGTTNVKFLYFDITGDQINNNIITSITLKDASPSTTVSFLQNLKIFNASTNLQIGSALPVLNPNSSLNLSIPSFVIAPGTLQSFFVTADISSSAQNNESYVLSIPDNGIKAVNQNNGTIAQIIGSATSNPVTVKASSQAHLAGTNVVDPFGTIYFINNLSQRQPYVSITAFNSYSFNSTSTVVQANPEDIALPVGDFILPMEGSLYTALGGSDSGTVYLISDGKKDTFASMTVFNGLGFSTSNAVGVSSIELSSIPAGTALTDPAARHPQGLLINKNGVVYYTGKTGIYNIPDLATFNSWGLSFSNVLPATSGDSALPLLGNLSSRTQGQLNPVVQ